MKRLLQLARQAPPQECESLPLGLDVRVAARALAEMNREQVTLHELLMQWGLRLCIVLCVLSVAVWWVRPFAGPLPIQLHQVAICP
jgi:hypothetical protein